MLALHRGARVSWIKLFLNQGGTADCLFSPSLINFGGGLFLLGAFMETIRELTKDDALQYYNVRLRALREHPEAFGSTAEVFEQRTLEQVADRLRQTSSQGFCIFGAFINDELVGLSAFGCPTDNPKMRHRARQFDGVEELALGVEAGNESARSLYQRVGFQTSYVDPRSLKIDDRYYDTEFMILRLE